MASGRESRASRRTVSVTIEGRRVVVRGWRYWIRGAGGHRVPVYLLDTCVPENSPWDQTLTDHLYGGDRHYRLCQEVVLGIGGVKLLRRLGHIEITTFHMNEGHAAFLSLALLEEEIGDPDLEKATEGDLDEIGKSASLRRIHRCQPAMTSSRRTKCDRSSAATEPRS